MTRPLAIGSVLALSLAIGADAASRRPPVAGTPTGCIDADRIVSRRVVAPQVVEFTLSRGRVYRSTLVQQCPHLAELDRTYLIEFDNRNGRRVCGGDRFRLVDPVAARSGRGAGFPFCRFGTFEEASR